MSVNSALLPCLDELVPSAISGVHTVSYSDQSMYFVFGLCRRLRLLSNVQISRVNITCIVCTCFKSKERNRYQARQWRTNEDSVFDHRAGR
jgi:hypothetical protein